MFAASFMASFSSRPQLAAGQHIIADADLMCDIMLPHALVHALVVRAVRGGKRDGIADVGRPGDRAERTHRLADALHQVLPHDLRLFLGEGCGKTEEAEHGSEDGSQDEQPPPGGDRPAGLCRGPAVPERTVRKRLQRTGTSVRATSSEHASAPAYGAA